MRTEEKYIKSLVKRFFELIDKEEESDSGKIFKPNKLEINSVRCLDSQELAEILTKLRAKCNE